MVGWIAYHTLRSKGSEPGFPDWTLVRERVVFLELKTETGKPSPAQKFWISALLDASAEVYIARARDLQALSAILTARSPGERPHAYGSAAYDLREQTRAEVDG